MLKQESGYSDQVAAKCRNKDEMSRYPFVWLWSVLWSNAQELCDESHTTLIISDVDVWRLVAKLVRVDHKTFTIAIQGVSFFERAFVSPHKIAQMIIPAAHFLNMII